MCFKVIQCYAMCFYVTFYICLFYNVCGYAKSDSAVYILCVSMNSHPFCLDICRWGALVQTMWTQIDDGAADIHKPLPPLFLWGLSVSFIFSWLLESRETHWLSGLLHHTGWGKDALLKGKNITIRAVKWLITSRVKVCVYNICLYTVHIHLYLLKHTHIWI